MADSPPEPPAKRFKVDAANKKAVIQTLVNITRFQKEMSGDNVAKNLFDKSDIPHDELEKHYEEKVESEKEYEMYPPLDFVYYKFLTSSDEEDLDQEAQASLTGFDPKLFFILRFRQYFRIARRLVYFSYIQQGMIEECTRYNYLDQKIRHKFMESHKNLTPKRSDHLAKCMHLQDYTRFTDINHFRIKEAEPIPEREPELIQLLPKSGETNKSEEDKNEQDVPRETIANQGMLGRLKSGFAHFTGLA